MEQQRIQALANLFRQFADETRASSFAVENLYTKVLQIVDQPNQMPRQAPDLEVDNEAKE